MTPDLPSSPEEKLTNPVPSQSLKVPRRPLPRGVTVSMLSVLSIVVVVEAQMFWREWKAMRQEVQAADIAVPIGFHNVYTHPSRAIKPRNWYRPEGDLLYLWAGWDGTQHLWFTAGRDLDRTRLSEPISRDVIRSVNDPWVEVGGGLIWKRLPPEALVFGQSLSGVPTAYPMQLLAVMHVVNDQVEHHPFLALFKPSHPRELSVGIFDPRVKGSRLTMGTSGYLLDGKAMLYDHETESLWSEDGDAIHAVSGRYKGSRLPLVARSSPVSWSDWKARNPGSRLLVGTHEQPAQAPRAASAGMTLRQRPTL